MEGEVTERMERIGENVRYSGEKDKGEKGRIWGREKRMENYECTED